MPGLQRHWLWCGREGCGATGSGVARLQARLQRHSQWRGKAAAPLAVAWQVCGTTHSGVASLELEKHAKTYAKNHDKAGNHKYIRKQAQNQVIHKVHT
jgi:hypothetical protein